MLALLEQMSVFREETRGDLKDAKSIQQRKVTKLAVAVRIVSLVEKSSPL